MHRSRTILARVVALWLASVGGVSGLQGGGWTIPEGAAAEKNPLPSNESVLANGRKFFVSKCQRCHGTTGKGDGPDADPRRRRVMDLTAADGAERNPDGVVFYKIWNGRSSPRMPRFSEELSREQAWAIVAYVQSLRGGSF